jgi:hypothetical protein
MAHGTSLDHQPGFPAISYFHSSDELSEETSAAGLNVEAVYVEGPAWFLPEIETLWHDPATRQRLIWLARQVEREPAGLTTSAHLLLVARA